ncbi:LPXTG cell wall anchor domain-containing protein [Streptomyces sp. NBC_00878]|uniref:LPXTG cell wall anchor domain-containing protein n=1 Tax=Streptomyces sp. NBC_00878 TaxID=2975854 RepID=UPI00225B9C37|nr:LPXTG cell wall anchor domain-containing protein [Streptomyces sp. NBC_00878]MCX4908590.1 LPXTG cell wall anchor domain-containing protein [Streptomyces sp. NBC_00878]
MRQNLSRGMVVAAAATSILSLYGTPAFADIRSEETSGGVSGALSDTPAALPGDSALHNPENAPASASPKTSDVNTAPDPSPVNARISGSNHSGWQGAVRDSAQADGREHGDHGRHGDAARYGGYGSGYGDGGGYGDDDDGGGYGDESAYGDAGGYGDDESGYGDGGKPPTKPPITPSASPPPTTPPVKSPAASAPPTTALSTPPRTPPASPPTQPPSLAETGTNEQVLAASGIAALLLTSGAILYRRGRAGSGR